MIIQINNSILATEKHDMLALTCDSTYERLCEKFMQHMQLTSDSINGIHTDRFV